MVDELEKCLPAFSSVNRTRCFAHILNLIAKLILKLFDIKPKKKKAKTDGDGNGDGADDDEDEDEEEVELSDEERELLELAGDIEEEELATRLNQADDNEVDDNDDDDGWVDEVAELTAEEQETLKESIRPVSRMLVKVRELTHC